MSPKVARISLLVWVAVLFALAFGAAGIDVSIPIWDLQDTHRVLVWLRDRLLVAVAVVGLFLPLGALAVSAIAPPSPDPPHGFLRRLGTVVAAFALGLVVAALIAVVRSSPPVRPPTILGLILPALGCLVGTWIGCRARSGKLRRFALEALLALGTLGAVWVAVGWLALSEDSLDFDPSRVTAADKRRLVQLVRGKDPRRIRGDDTRTLSITEEDANQLLAWGLSIGSKGRKARVQLYQGEASLSVSIRLPAPILGRQYFNVVAEEVARFDTALHLKTTRFDVGELSAPHWILAVLSSALLGELTRDDHVQPLLEAIHSLEITPEGVSVTYGRVELPETYTADVFARLGGTDDVVPSTQAQVDHLVELAFGAKRQLSFGECFEAAFRTARSRSAEGGDPVEENRAAVFALGILLGHHRVRTFVGPVELQGVPKPAWRQFRRVTVRGRRDWTQHFTVSATLELVSNVATSDAVGLLKEELDAGAGGSGFSFADLLADRAGTTFARAAARDRQAAVALQKRIGKGFRVDDFFPPATDLPEGIPDRELERRYGGVGGEPFRQLTEEIERRVAACAAYRDVARE